MKNKLFVLLFIGIIFQITIGCATKWTEAIKAGEISPQQFEETLSIEEQIGLIFVPVTIDGKSYRFLFDTGAPLSISNELQEIFNFKKISEGTIVDSDGNKTSITWVKVPTIEMGSISYLDQSAFVGDFNANPLLKCLNIDGIIGSNLIRFCNWTIDQEAMTMTFFKNKEQIHSEKVTRIPFKTDEQFNMFIKLPIGKATANNVLVDYGSNGAVALSKNSFDVLKEHEIVDSTYIESGYQKRGLVGKAIKIRREITYTDSVSLGKTPLHNVMIRTGKKASIGNKLLSNYKVTINWKDKTLDLYDIEQEPEAIRFSGFKLGYSEKLGVYVQSVIENSNAYQKGVRPLMKVVQLDQLDFENGNVYCDYAAHSYEDDIYLKLKDTTGKITKFRFKQNVE